MTATTRGQRRTSDKHRTAVGVRRKAVERAALDLICDVIDTDLPTDAILARFGRAVQQHLPGGRDPAAPKTAGVEGAA